MPAHTVTCSLRCAKASSSQVHVAPRSSAACKSAHRNARLEQGKRVHTVPAVRRNVSLRAVAEEASAQSDLDERKGYIKAEDLSPMTNVESFAEDTAVGGEGESILLAVPGGVGESLHFLPFIQTVHQEMPNAALDIVAAPRACATYELCPYIRNTLPYDVNGDVVSSESADVLGILKGNYYKTVVTALPAGLTRAVYYWLVSSTNLVGYVKDQDLGYATDFMAPYFFNVPVTPDAADVSTLGSAAYDKLLASLLEGYEKAKVQIGVPPAAATWAEGVCSELGLTAGSFVLVHGLPSDSDAAMSMWADSAGASLPMATWADFAAACSLPILFATPREDISAEVVESIPGAKVVVAANPSKLAALVSASGKVVCSNTAAVPLSDFLSKPAVAAFSDEKVAANFSGEYSLVTALTGEVTGKALADALA